MNFVAKPHGTAIGFIGKSEEMKYTDTIRLQESGIQIITPAHYLLPGIYRVLLKHGSACHGIISIT